MTIWGNVLQSNIRLLHQVTRTCTQYPGNVLAKVSYDSVQQEIMQACEKIKQLLTFGPDEDDSTVSFVRVVDKVMDALTEAQRSELNEDFESEIVTLVQHSMAVAHYTHGVYKDVIVASCHRVRTCCPNTC
ncbi:unnamed protein product [Lymnaea stagnalis]|uniref:Uncharacterized protein n=1 Tax=Lymnaea stagnalis TaxID=6523 RepID=A0AAV2IDH0_LYMST